MSVKATVVKEAKDLMNQGYSQRTVATMLGIARSTLQWWLREDNGEPSRNEKKEIEKQSPVKILFYDLETSPTAGWVWGRWKQNVSQAQVEAESFILTYSAKWLGNPNVVSSRITEPENDKKIIEELHQLFNEADLVVAHNGNKFDNGIMNARSVFHGMQPYAPVKFVDTLQIAKKNFRFPSNSLDSLAQYLGLGQKVKHSGFDLWKRCMNMEDEAFAEMLEYNEMDVILLEQVYLKLRAWDAKAPNLNVYFNDDVSRCPCCGSHHLNLIDKLSYTQQSAFSTYQCKECGKVSRAKKNHRSKEAMQSTLVNVIQ